MFGGEFHGDAPFTRQAGRRYYTYAPEAAAAAGQDGQLRFTRGLGYWVDRGGGPAFQGGPVRPPQRVSGPLPQGIRDMPMPGHFLPRPMPPDILDILRRALASGQAVQY